MRNAGRNQEESSNALDRCIVLSTRPRIGSLPRTNNQPNMEFEFNMMTGSMTDCNFYVPDSTGDSTGLSFRVAFDDAVKQVRTYNDDSHKKLCTCSTQPLRNTVINFLLNNLEHPNSQIRSLCQCLSYVLSWSGDMRVFTIMYERLVKTKSPVLSHSLVIAEVDNLEELVKAIASHTYPQYFSHLCSVSELFYLDVSRFRTLFAVALEMDIASNSSYSYDFKSENVSNAYPTTVQQLVKFHFSAMAKNQVSERILTTIPGI
ncbi:hypothetical protein MtrunA17_Chr2g0293791 [Medicago truncatula]|uniref:Uncharacterized protein n=1 Tax=Medicago truncatula TaxID=3880 RepID=G7IL18_MEDTR|nr:hypothetical protein MTR_2g032960 [Medicago truncatula]KEH37140.1 hypothetical protein MTR_2g032935 [Medicago truncatula]RHN73002.1 hypothetical protein MtrunA17_Chr2g0293791 [Medicago truncatula]